MRNKLKIEELTKTVKDIKREIWLINHPVKYKFNDKLTLYDEFSYERKKIKCICKGVIEIQDLSTENSFDWCRIYAVEQNHSIIHKNENYLSKQKKNK